MTTQELSRLRSLPPGEERDRLLRYIKGIADPITRKCFELRFIRGLTWESVARELGGGNAEITARMRVYRELWRS